jgi:decaprenyl-phosphate phosphoribosyltransferase
MRQPSQGDRRTRVKFVKDILSLIRVKQWIKNCFVFIPLFFSGKLMIPWESLLCVYAFLSFDLISSVVYIINDLCDIEADKLHPRKSKRPLPAGRIKPPVAVVIAVLVFTAGSTISIFLVNNILFTISLGSYFILNIAYSFWGKHVVILDALLLAAFFVIRVIGGSFAIMVEPSGWLIMTTFFLSLFLGFGKRRNEYISLQKDKGLHRKVLEEYDLTLLNHFIFASCGIAIMSYALYTLSSVVTAHFKNGDKLVYTIPFFTFILFRYAISIWKKEEGDPTEVVLHDPAIIISVFLCAAIALSLMYLPWRF